MRSREALTRRSESSHRISDPKTAQSSGQSLFEPHERVRLPQFCPSHDFSAATCIWEAESVDAVCELVDPTLGDASEQTFFAVSTE